MKNIFKTLAVLLVSVTVLVGCASSGIKIDPNASAHLFGTELVPVSFMDSSRDSQLIPWSNDVVDTAIQTQTVGMYFLMGFDLEAKVKGDSCLLVFPNGETMLIDAMTTASGIYLVENLKTLGISRIDYLVFTHPHDDHCYGAINSSFFNDFEIGKCYTNGVQCSSWGSKMGIIEDISKKYGFDLVYLKRGDTLDIGDVHIDVISPNPRYLGTVVDTGECNETSIVMRIQYGDMVAMFTGDMEKGNDAECLELYEPEFLDSDFLKIAHHGLENASSSEFIEVLSPEIAVCTGRGSVPSALYTDIAKYGGKSYMDTIDGYMLCFMSRDDIAIYTSMERQTKYYETYDRVAELLRQKEAAQK